MKKILLLWYTLGDNFGDVLIYETVSRYLMDASFKVETHEVGDRAEKIVEHANKCNFMLFAGGGIIERYVPDIIKRFYDVQDLLVVPYGIMGLSVGNFNYDIYRKSINYWIENARFFFVRDSTTEYILNQFTKSKSVTCMTDCVFANNRIGNNREVLHSEIGMNVRDLPYKDLTGDFDWNVISSIKNTCKVNIVIMDSSQEIIKILDGDNNLGEYIRYRELSRNKKIDYIINQINHCKLVIAMRYHVILVAALLGVPSVPILYCPKVERLSKELGIRDISVTIDEYNQIPNKVDMLLEHYDYYQSVVLENRNILVNKANLMFREIIDILMEI